MYAARPLTVTKSSISDEGGNSTEEEEGVSQSMRTWLTERPLPFRPVAVTESS